MDRFLWLVLLFFTPFLKTADGGSGSTPDVPKLRLTSFRSDSPVKTYDPGLGSRKYLSTYLGGMAPTELLIYTLKRAESGDTHKEAPHEPVRFKIADRAQAAQRIIDGITKTTDLTKLQTLIALLQKADPEFQEAELLPHIHADPRCNLLNDKLDPLIRNLNTWVAQHDKETSAPLSDELATQFEHAQYLATLINPEFLRKDFAACKRGVLSLLPKKESKEGDDALPHEASDGKIHPAHSEHLPATVPLTTFLGKDLEVMQGAASGGGATKPVDAQPAFPNPKDVHGKTRTILDFARGRKPKK
jgi:hypothetical protein